MYKIVGLLCVSLISLCSFAQQPNIAKLTPLPADSVVKATQDTVKESRRARKRREELEAKAKEPIIFKDSTRLAIEAKTTKAWKRSALVPGWGQKTNGGLWWIKVPLIYGGLATTVVVFDFNNRYYKELLEELAFRTEFPNASYQNPDYQYASTQGLISAKDYARRNRDLMVLLTVGVYGLNIVEAYVDSMLKYRWNIGQKMGVKVTPTWMYAPNGTLAYTKLPVMGAKITLQLK